MHGLTGGQLGRGVTRWALGALLATATLLLIAGPASGGSDSPAANAAGKRKPVKVKVGDDFFSPDALRVKKRTTVKWRWLAKNSRPHNVTLTKGPKGVNKGDFTSGTGVTGVKFSAKLKKPGSYKFICTIHATSMKQTITVKRPRR